MKDLFLFVPAFHPGYLLDEVELYPPNEPQFVEEQLSERIAKALLSV
ncbi:MULTISPECIES: hypothetical protein [Methylobacter]